MDKIFKINLLVLLLLQLIIFGGGCGNMIRTSYMPVSLEGTPKKELAKLLRSEDQRIIETCVDGQKMAKGIAVIYVLPGKHEIMYRRYVTGKVIVSGWKDDSGRTWDTIEKYPIPIIKYEHKETIITEAGKKYILRNDTNKAWWQRERKYAVEEESEKTKPPLKQKNNLEELPYYQDDN